MVCNYHLSKAISDAAWGQFLSFIIYKAAEAGKWCIEVEPQGTTQICSGCDSVVAKKLSDRVHDCWVCGLKLNRDHNSAIVILSRAIALIASTASIASIASIKETKEIKEFQTTVCLPQGLRKVTLGEERGCSFLRTKKPRP
jgi:transposase